MGALDTDYEVNGKRSKERLDHARKPLDAFFKHYRAASITTTAIRKYQRERLADVSPATVNREIAYLRRALRLAHHENRLARLPHVPMLSEPKARDVTLENDGELVSLVNALPEHHKRWVALAACTGWRRNAILSRTWADIITDSDGTRWLTLDRKSSKNAEAYRFPVVGDVKRILDEQRAYVEKLERETETVTRWIFPYPDGRQIRNPEFWFRRAAKAAGCPDLHIHDLRRFAVSRMVEMGVAEADVMALAGMETRSILDRYNVTNERRKVAAVERLTGALDAKPSKQVVGFTAK